MKRLFRWFGRQIGRMMFGNWRRTIATLVIAGLVLARYYPAQVWPIMAPLLQIGIVILGIRVMLVPFWPRRRRKKTSK